MVDASPRLRLLLMDLGFYVTSQLLMLGKMWTVH